MKVFRYIEDVATLQLDSDTCVGCGNCLAVCPHQIFALADGKAVVTDANACIECGACARNCPVHALSVTPGVGCASLMIQRWLHEKGIRVKSVGGCC